MRVEHVPQHLLDALGKEKYLSHLAYNNILKYANAHGIAPVRGNWEYCDLSNKNLSHAILTESAMSGARFDGSDLTGAVLYHVDASGANFTGTILNCTNLSGAHLFGCEGIVQFGPCPGIGRIGYAVDHSDRIMVRLGCWWGDLDSTIARLRQLDRPPAYEQIVLAAAAVLECQRP